MGDKEGSEDKVASTPGSANEVAVKVAMVIKNKSFCCCCSCLNSMFIFAFTNFKRLEIQKLVKLA